MEKQRGAKTKGGVESIKEKMQLMFKGLWFCCGTALGFFQAAFKDPKMSPIIKGHLKGYGFLWALFFGCGFRGLRLRFSKNAHFWVFLVVQFFRGEVFLWVWFFRCTVLGV